MPYYPGHDVAQRSRVGGRGMSVWNDFYGRPNFNPDPNAIGRPVPDPGMSNTKSLNPGVTNSEGGQVPGVTKPGKPKVPRQQRPRPNGQPRQVRSNPVTGGGNEGGYNPTDAELMNIPKTLPGGSNAPGMSSGGPGAGGPIAMIPDEPVQGGLPPTATEDPLAAIRNYRLGVLEKMLARPNYTFSEVDQARFIPKWLVDQQGMNAMNPRDLAEMYRNFLMAALGRGGQAPNPYDPMGMG